MIIFDTLVCLLTALWCCTHKQVLKRAMVKDWLVWRRVVYWHTGGQDFYRTSCFKFAGEVRKILNSIYSEYPSKSIVDNPRPRPDTDV